MKIKILHLPNGYKRVIYGKFFEKFDLDFYQPLDDLKTDIEFALAVIEKNQSLFKKIFVFKNKNIRVYQGGHHLDIIDDGKKSLEWLIIEDHWTEEVSNIKGSWKIENQEISRQTQYEMQQLRLGTTNIDQAVEAIKQRILEHE